MTWVLVYYIITNASAITTNSIEGFKTKKACDAAGDEIRDGFDKYTQYVCVKK
jgi:hypothetical protein